MSIPFLEQCFVPQAVLAIQQSSCAIVSDSMGWHG